MNYTVRIKCILLLLFDGMRIKDYARMVLVCRTLCLHVLVCRILFLYDTVSIDYLSKVVSCFAFVCWRAYKYYIYGSVNCINCSVSIVFFYVMIKWCLTVRMSHDYTFVPLLVMHHFC